MNIQIKTHEKLIALGVGIIVLVNPLVGQYIILAITMAYEQLLLVGDLAATAGTVLVVVGLVLGNKYSRGLESLRIAKSKKKPSNKSGMKYETL